MKKEQTKKIETNKNLSVDYSAWKKNITAKRYFYYAFNFEKVKAIAEKEENISNEDCRILAQALFPQYLQCSGIFDGFLFFEVHNGIRVDPPKYFYATMSSYLNNDEEAKVNRMLDEVKDLFEKNGIHYSQLWAAYFKTTEG